MAKRSVTRSGKDEDGDITSLCGSGTWSPVSKSQAIKDIESNINSYFVHGRTEILVVKNASVSGGKYLRTAPNNEHNDNLDELPDC